jgi:hypothetical protein
MAEGGNVHGWNCCQLGSLEGRGDSGGEAQEVDNVLAFPFGKLLALRCHSKDVRRVHKMRGEYAVTG